MGTPTVGEIIYDKMAREAGWPPRKTLSAAEFDDWSTRAHDALMAFSRGEKFVVPIPRKLVSQ